MGKGKTCIVCYHEMYNSMGQTVLGVIHTICKLYVSSYEELKSKLPDEIANHGARFTQHPVVIKKESDLKDEEKTPKARFFYNEPIYLENDKFNIVVNNQWNEDNFASFCKAVNEQFSIEIEFGEKWEF